MKFRRLALALLLLSSVFFAFAEGEQENQENPLNKKLDTRGLLPLLAKDIEEGSYEIETASSSSMFKIEKTVLYVKDNAMTADITLSGKGYSNVTMLSAADSEGLTSLEGTTATVGKDGKYVFTLPVQSLNTELVCSAFSKKKQKWYERRVVFYSEKIPAENLFVTPYVMQKCGLKDGSYTISVKLAGGSGRASVKSPASLRVKDGIPLARIEWSSPNYDYMILNGEKILPLANEQNSVFELPVLVFDKAMSVFADTTAMSTPHEILYQLEFSLETAQRKGFSLAALIILATALLTAALAIFFIMRLCLKKRK
ncbi:MAG: hypothetical protein IIT57_02135 [Treponema sp.]|nr:hypothetical protein [Treponema sp.]MBQ4024049.1 hypothetical protein [Treponema sp.]MBQ5448817.1 hypothetical protein [Treponema sp.]